MRPDDGLTLCRAIRRDSANVETPILMLTARREESDKVLGLDSGADDYLTKPFGVRELMARVRALLRRGPSRAAEQEDDDSKPIEYKHIRVDPSRRKVTVANRDVELTSQEFQLLTVLISNPGIVFSREALLRRVWKDDTHVTVRSVDTLVKRLRKKIEDDAAEPAVILTVWGTELGPMSEPLVTGVPFTASMSHVEFCSRFRRRLEITRRLALAPLHELRG
jgi:two-component system OmpR family response regulator/two-component system alkaline phosphatase synthesis response regulator PhoP